MNSYKYIWMIFIINNYGDNPKEIQLQKNSNEKINNNQNNINVYQQGRIMAIIKFINTISDT
jgi:hypothetical protein